MMGVFVRAWSYLPIEEVFVWMTVTYATVIVFEVFKVGFASERSASAAMLGVKSDEPAPKSVN